MNQYIGFLSALLNKVVGGLESMSGVLSVTVIEIEDEMFKMFWVIEVKVNS